MGMVFLGTGSAFSQDYFQSNVVLEVDGKRLLIDAGGDVRADRCKRQVSHSLISTRST